MDKKVKYLRIAKAKLIQSSNGFGYNIQVSMVASYNDQAKYVKFEKLNEELMEKLLNSYAEVEDFENDEDPKTLF